MNRKSLEGKADKVKKGMRPSEVIDRIREKIVILYAAAIFGVFPLFVQDGFFDIGIAKFRFAVWAALISVVLWIFCCIAKWDFPKTSCLKAWDGLLALFLFWGAVSVLTGEYGLEAFFGYNGRFCGLFLYLVYGAICVMIVGTGKFFYRGILLFEISGAAVGILGILNRYQADPLRMYEGMIETEKPIFTSTMGNINTQGVFLGLLFVLAAGNLACAKGWGARIFQGLVCVVASMGMGANNADGGFLAVAAFFALFWIGLKSAEELLGFFAAGLLFGGAVFAVELLEKRFAGRVPLEGICGFLTGNFRGGFVALVFSLCMILLFLMRKKEWGLKWLKRGLMAGMLFGAFTFALAFGVANWWNPQLADKLGIGFLTITDSWGSNRGYVFRKTLEGFASLSPGKKLIGTGPDTAGHIYQQVCTEPFYLEKGQYYTQAHNEYLQFVLTHGILGTVCYFAWFLASGWQMIKRGRKDARYYVLAMVLVAYLAMLLVNCSVVNYSAILFLLVCCGKCGE